MQSLYRQGMPALVRLARHLGVKVEQEELFNDASADGRLRVMVAQKVLKVIQDDVSTPEPDSRLQRYKSMHDSWHWEHQVHAPWSFVRQRLITGKI